MNKSVPLLTMDIQYEQDVVASRQRARQIAEHLGFDSQDQTRIATAVSEITRNAFRYAVGGKAEFLWDSAGRSLIVRISDSGPGIQNLDVVLRGEYSSQTGMGVGIVGARKLSDSFHIDSEAGRGTTVILEKTLPARHPGEQNPDVSKITSALIHSKPVEAYDEVKAQNRELIQALDVLTANENRLAELNRELRETNRGVVALYAELDEKASALQAASEMKSRFLTNISHEFRTPIASVVNLTWLLLEEADGPLLDEQKKQISLIGRSSQMLADLVNDLLDLAKIESGKVDIIVRKFELSDLFATLRGIFKPLLSESAAKLIIDDIGACELQSDEGKVSQILRNLISNAVKFTPAGEIRLTTEVTGDTIVINVADSGIGIPEEHISLIFEEFHQIRGPLQSKHKGTGLGLPLSKQLAKLLGGTLTVESEVGIGSTFQLTLPRICPGVPLEKDAYQSSRSQEKVLNG